MPFQEVILTENIRGLGAEADVVKVKRGYARNFLLPRGKAYEVNPAAQRRMAELKVKRAEREGKERNEAEEIARRINKLRLTLILETGAQGKAFGSITQKDIEDALKKELSGVELERHAVELERPIKTTGEFELPVRLHPEVSATLKVLVKPSVEPAPVAADETDAQKTVKAGYKGKPKPTAAAPETPAS